MTTKEQDTTERQREPGNAPVSGELGASAGADRTGASQRQPIFGDSPAVCRAMVKKLFGKRHWAAPWVLDLCNADPQFAIHLAEQPRGYVHFLCLIRMALAEWGGNGGDAQEMARLLCAGNKRALLVELFPSCPADIIDLLHKLPKKPFHEEGYWALMGALEDESMRNDLLHSKRISDAIICSLPLIVNLPAKFRFVAMFCDNIESPWNYLQFLQIIGTIDKFNLKVTEQEFSEIVRGAASSGRVLFRKFADWVEQKISMLPFPAPPWDGDDKIRPVRSIEELKHVAARFKGFLSVYRHPNSSYSTASRIALGYEYIYVCDCIPAVIQVMRGTRDGWCLTIYDKWSLTGWGILEIRKKKIRESELRQVFQKFQDAGFYPDLSFGLSTSFGRAGRRGEEELYQRLD